MMAAAGSHDLGQAHRRAAAAALSGAPWAHGLALQSALARVLQQQATRAVAAGAALPSLPLDGRALGEAAELAVAIGQQWLTLQAQWLDGLGELADEMAQMRHVNTVSKLVDQEMNLVQTAVALVTDQVSATARVTENIESNLAYWLSLKAGA